MCIRDSTWPIADQTLRAALLASAAKRPPFSLLCTPPTSPRFPSSLSLVSFVPRRTQLPGMWSGELYCPPEYRSNYIVSRLFSTWELTGMNVSLRNISHIFLRYIVFTFCSFFLSLCLLIVNINPPISLLGGWKPFFSRRVRRATRRRPLLASFRNSLGRFYVDLYSLSLCDQFSEAHSPPQCVCLPRVSHSLWLRWKHFLKNVKK